MALKGKGCLNKCPKCKSENISATNWECGFDDCSCDVTCRDCFFGWYEVYKADYWEEIE